MNVNKKAEYQPWAIGFRVKNRIIFHPYLKIGFLFDCDKK